MDASLLGFSIGRVRSLSFVAALTCFLGMNMFDTIVSHFSNTPVSVLMYYTILCINTAPLRAVNVVLACLMFVHLAVCARGGQMGFGGVRMFPK